MLIVDRIEGETALCEQADRTMLSIPLAQLPEGVREGDCLICRDGAYTIDTEEAARRRKQNSDRLLRLMKKGSAHGKSKTGEK